MRRLAILILVLPLAGCGSLMDLACAFRAPSEVERMGDAIQPKAP